MLIDKARWNVGTFDGASWQGEMKHGWRDKQGEAFTTLLGEAPRKQTGHLGLLLTFKHGICLPENLLKSLLKAPPSQLGITVGSRCRP